MTDFIIDDAIKQILALREEVYYVDGKPNLSVSSQYVNETINNVLKILQKTNPPFWKIRYFAIKKELDEIKANIPNPVNFNDTIEFLKRYFEDFAEWNEMVTKNQISCACPGPILRADPVCSCTAYRAVRELLSVMRKKEV